VPNITEALGKRVCWINVGGNCIILFERPNQRLGCLLGKDCPRKVRLSRALDVKSAHRVWPLGFCLILSVAFRSEFLNRVHGSEASRSAFNRF